MGYCVEMELRSVRFNNKKSENVRGVLSKLNESWLRNRDWCRYDIDNDSDLMDIFDCIGFETGDDGNYTWIKYFNREKLGDHENMFEKLAPHLEDCQVVIYGEDDTDWRLDIKDGKMSKKYRENL